MCLKQPLVQVRLTLFAQLIRLILSGVQNLGDPGAQVIKVGVRQVRGFSKLLVSRLQCRFQLVHAHLLVLGLLRCGLSRMPCQVELVFNLGQLCLERSERLVYLGGVVAFTHDTELLVRHLNSPVDSHFEVWGRLEGGRPERQPPQPFPPFL